MAISVATGKMIPPAVILDEFSQVKNAYLRNRLRQRRNLEQGLCRCGRQPRDGRKSCKRCADSVGRSQKRYNNKPFGDQKPCGSCGKLFQPTRQRTKVCSFKCACMLGAETVNAFRTIRDEFTHMPVCRQVKKQLRYAKKGVCRICGKGSTEASGTKMCALHMDLYRNR